MSINIYGTENKQNEQISRTHLTIVLKNNWCLSYTCVKISSSCNDPKNKHCDQRHTIRGQCNLDVYNRNTKNVIAIIVHSFLLKKTNTIIEAKIHLCIYENKVLLDAMYLKFDATFQFND